MTAADRPVLVAPDKFRGTLSADAVAAAIAEGLARVGIDSDRCRIADGGEGTIDALASQLELEISEVEVSGALGQATRARVALLGDGRKALVESAEAIGLEQIPRQARDALAAGSAGVGQLIAAAAGLGAREVFVGIGGTASTDGGAGAVDALREAGLLGVRGPLKGCPRITALCDVRAAWEQAAPVFAPQKGAGEQEVDELVERLEVLAGELPKDPRGKLMTGAGGGLAGGLWAAAGAQLKGGAAFVLDQLGFTARMTAARAVITGEGAVDHQTLLGKAVGEVGTRARQSGVPCHVIAGRFAMSEFDARVLDFESWREAGTAAELADAAAELAPVLAAY